MKKLLLVILVGLYIDSNAQGCSDAGFCSLNNTMPYATSTSKKMSTIRMGMSYGVSRSDITVFTPFVELSNSVSKVVTLNVKANMQYMSNNDIETNNIGDVFLTGDFKFMKYVTSTIGFKVPLSLGNKSENGIMLPMDFQSSLGTYDFLFGLQYRKDNFLLGAGWQQPLTQNKNTYLPVDFLGSNKYFATNQFYRNSDIWARAGYTLDVNYHFKITPNILPIVHLGNDNYREFNGEKKHLNGSSGLTLNADVQFELLPSEYLSLGLNLGFPIINRTNIPDGTSRKFVSTFDCRVKF